MPKKQSDLLERMRSADARAAAPPPPFEDMLPSGLVALWRMPDPFAIVAFDGVIPDPLTAAVIKLLKEEKSYTPENDPRTFRNDAQAIMGMYGLVGAMLESPRLDPRVEYGDGDGTLGRRELGYKDVSHLYWLFLLGSRSATVPAPDPTQPVGAADAPSDSGDVSPDASAAAPD